eukprot:g186.t1
MKVASTSIAVLLCVEALAVGVAATTSLSQTCVVADDGTVAYSTFRNKFTSSKPHPDPVFTQTAAMIQSQLGLHRQHVDNDQQVLHSRHHQQSREKDSPIWESTKKFMFNLLPEKYQSMLNRLQGVDPPLVAKDSCASKETCAACAGSRDGGGMFSFFSEKCKWSNKLGKCFAADDDVINPSESGDSNSEVVPDMMLKSSPSECLSPTTPFVYVPSMVGSLIKAKWNLEGVDGAPTDCAVMKETKGRALWINLDELVHAAVSNPKISPQMIMGMIKAKYYPGLPDWVGGVVDGLLKATDNQPACYQYKMSIKYNEAGTKPMDPPGVQSDINDWEGDRGLFHDPRTRLPFDFQLLFPHGYELGKNAFGAPYAPAKTYTTSDTAEIMEKWGLGNAWKNDIVPARKLANTDPGVKIYNMYGLGVPTVRNATQNADGSCKTEKATPEECKAAWDKAFPDPAARLKAMTQLGCGDGTIAPEGAYANACVQSKLLEALGIPSSAGGAGASC